jgi:hypothetical protein
MDMLTDAKTATVGTSGSQTELARYAVRRFTLFTLMQYGLGMVASAQKFAAGKAETTELTVTVKSAAKRFGSSAMRPSRVWVDFAL